MVVFHDITRRKKSERRLAAQYETTRVLAEADTPAQANVRILETICEKLDWDYGAFWRVDSHTKRLRCASLWHRAAVSAPAFEGLTRKFDLPARRRASRPCLGQRPACLDSGDGPLTPILPVARRPRKTACGQPSPCPSSCEASVWASSSFSATRPRPPDLAMLEMMNSLGTQIGQLIERHQMRAPRHSIREARIARDAVGRGGPRDQ